MNYDNITKENFIEYEDNLFKLIDLKYDIYLKHKESDFEKKIKTRLVDENGNDYFNKYDASLNIGFSKLFKFSHKNNIYFQFCSSIVYENTFEDRFKVYENEFIDVKKIDFIKSEYDNIINVYWYQRNQMVWGLKELELFNNAETRKLNFLEKFLLENNYTVKTSYNAFRIETKRGTVRNILVEFKENRQQTPTTIKPKTNKSLLFNGSNLNLSERFKIANEVLNIDNKIRTLNIPELEKYQLLAYILGCDKDNARNIMNGRYNSNDRDLTNYFDDLGLNK